MQLRWHTWQDLRNLLHPPPPDPAEQLFRIKGIERDIILPIKLLYVLILFYFFFFSRWYGEAGTAREIAQTIVERFYLIYVFLNVGVAVFLLAKKRMPLVWGQRVVFATSFVDTLFLAALILVTGGFDSILYWLFPGLIVRNAVSHPVARPQIILNVSVVVSFVVAGVLDIVTTNYDIFLSDELPANPTEPFFLRFMVLVLLSVACYGLQALFQRARLAVAEAREFVSRQEQLRAAGRVAAEVAHQIKNPLGIINNAAFAIQRAVNTGRPVPLQQVEIIREEVARSDRIVTELMGYAQLAEGAVERLNVVEELNRAINKVLPPGVYRGIRLRTDYDDNLPPLLMQQRHFAEIVMNILQNAREALVGGGEICISAETHDHAVRIIISDNGPGISPEKIEKVFEAYFSTKETGTGLGLAIARHNAEIYSGRVHVESELGHGARFILDFPTRTFMRLRK